MFYANCILCEKYSNGNQYCYDCYQKIIKEYLIQKNSLLNINNECFKCKNTIKEFGYCLKCYRKHIAEKPETVANYYIDKYRYLNNIVYKPSEKKATSKRKCMYCTKYALLGSYLCEDHYHTLVKEAKSNYQNNNNNNKYYNNKPQFYKLSNGTIVKSKSEHMICDFLSNHSIEFEYEKPLYYSKYKNPLKPDFYIKRSIFSNEKNPIKKFLNKKEIKDVYIEHFGGANSRNPAEQENYKKIINYKLPIYKQMKITLICTYEEDLIDIEKTLTEKLLNYKKGEINYLK